MEHVTQHYFWANEASPPGAEQAFQELTDLITTQPTTASAVLVAATTPMVMRAVTETLSPDDTSPRATTIRLIGNILCRAYDQDVDFDPKIDGAMANWLRHNRSSGIEERRLQRLKLFMHAVLDASRTKSV